MANTADPKNPTSIDNVLQALASERAYQLFRWGYRQPDAFIEAKHSVADYVLYIQDYYTEARGKASRCAGTQPAVEVLRKVVCLAIACLETCYNYSFTRLIHSIRTQAPEVAEIITPDTDFSQFMLWFSRIIDSAAEGAFEDDDISILLSRLIAVGVECFCRYGIEPRALAGIINARDGQAVSPDVLNYSI